MCDYSQALCQTQLSQDLISLEIYEESKTQWMNQISVYDVFYSVIYYNIWIKLCIFNFLLVS